MILGSNRLVSAKWPRWLVPIWLSKPSTVCAYGTAVWAEPAARQRDQGPQYQQHQAPQQGHLPPYGDPQPGGPPMAARNLTMGLHDRPR